METRPCAMIYTSRTQKRFHLAAADVILINPVNLKWSCPCGYLHFFILNRVNCSHQKPSFTFLPGSCSVLPLLFHHLFPRQQCQAAHRCACLLIGFSCSYISQTNLKQNTNRTTAKISPTSTNSLVTSNFGEKSQERVLTKTSWRNFHRGVLQVSFTSRQNSDTLASVCWYGLKIQKTQFVL